MEIYVNEFRRVLHCFRSILKKAQPAVVVGNVMLAALPLAVCVVNANAQQSARAVSQWVYYDGAGKLAYKHLENGSRIMDFSYAGYGGGGVALPDVPVRITLSPVAGDNTEAIQQAIDKVSRMPLTGGFRGAVLLDAGRYDCAGTLRIEASGVVLRGAGPNEGGTVINMTGRPHLCIAAGGRPGVRKAGPASRIADRYVPSGTSAFHLADASGFSVGDTILITRPVTKEWVAFMGMDKLVRNGKKQTWIQGDIVTRRVITNIEGHLVSLDVPLSDAYDAAYTVPGVRVEKVSVEGTVCQVGVENLRIYSRPQSGTINQRHDQALSMRGVSDGWARNIDIFNTVNSINVTGEQITMDRINIRHELPTVGAAKPADINGSGYRLLFSRCHITGDNVFYFVTGARVSGPVVLLDCVFRGNGWIQPHQRWATGLLVDNCQVPDGGIELMNRGEYGSGHGWTVGWAVAWNASAKSLLNQQPPGAANWMIGCMGTRERRAMPFNKTPVLADGFFDAFGTRVQPRSLYLAQLAERCGKDALKNIGYPAAKP